MNKNRIHEYENYISSYGMQEIQREARQARMFKDAQDNEPKDNQKENKGVRIVPSTSIISSLRHLFGRTRRHAIHPK